MYIDPQRIKEVGEEYSKSGIRFLDIDDLIIMRHLAAGEGTTAISKALKLTPPAVTHRLNKYQTMLGSFFEEGREHNRRILTDRGVKICEIAQRAMNALAEMSEG